MSSNLPNRPNPSTAEVDAARILLTRLGLRAEDLLDTPAPRPTAPASRDAVPRRRRARAPRARPRPPPMPHHAPGEGRHHTITACLPHADGPAARPRQGTRRGRDTKRAAAALPVRTADHPPPLRLHLDP